MGSDYFSLVNPWVSCRLQFLDLPGFHEYSYSLAFNEIDPMGSTNYGKLTNISIVQLQALLLKLVLLVLVLLEVDKTSHKHSSSLLQALNNTSVA